MKNIRTTILASLLTLVPVVALFFYFRGSYNNVITEPDPQQLREILQDRSSTETQKEEAGKLLRDYWQKQMDQRMEEYFTAPDDKKVTILDRHIDEIVKERNDRSSSRPSYRPTSRPNRALTQQEIKLRSESRNPDRMAMSMAYFSALRERMQQRGIQIPRFGGK